MQLETICKDNIEGKGSFVWIDIKQDWKSSNKSYDKEIQNKTNIQLPNLYKTTFISELPSDRKPVWW